MKKVLLSVVAILGVAAVASAQSPEDVVYFHTDAVGSIRLTTAQNGQPIEHHDYAPFGEPVQIGAGPSRYAGSERDGETGMQYFGARYYLPVTGRFTSVDPVLDRQSALLDPQQWNRYAYVRNNPLKFTDPDGRNPLLIVPILYGLYEVGSTVYDAYSTYQTFRDPDASATERAVMSGGLLVGAIAPGGGYAAGGRALFRSSVELGRHIESIGLKIENILTKNLDSATVQAAVRELRGEVVAINPKTGARFDHVTKVLQAARGLQKQADEIKRLLSSGDLTKKARNVLELQLRRTRETLADLKSNGLVP